ncbi:MAG: PAS domain S-box protein [Candidatus Brocadiia bacterium]|jgi:PAS domain S-box-containing protein
MKLGAKLTVAFVLGLLIIGAVGIQSYRAIQRLTETNLWVVQTHEVLENLERVQSALKDAETGQRGFVLTGDERYLEPFNAATGEIQKDIASVRSLTQDNPEQQERLDQLQKLSSDKLDELRETIKLRREGGMEAALPVIRTDRGKAIMDDFRTLVARMEQREGDLLETRNRAAGEVARQSTLMLGFGVLLSLAILGISAVIVIRTMRLAGRSMRLGGAGRKWPGIAVRYAFAVAVVALATWLKSWLERNVGPMPIFVTFYPAVLLVASVAGGGPGIAATVLSALAADYWFIEPTGQFGIANANDAMALGIYSGSSIFLSILAERLRRARGAEAVSAAQEQELALLNMGNLMSLDLDHRIVRWSEGNRRLYGFDADEAQGKLTYELLQTHFDRPLEQIHGELLGNGQWEGEATRRSKDGTQMSLALLWALRRDERGKPLAILEVSTDITRQKTAEESLRQQTEELAQQNEELTRQTEELAQQSEELTQQNEELATQSGEIQALNTELGHRENMLQALLASARLPLGEQDALEKICQAALEMFGLGADGAVICERRGEELHILAHAGFDGAEVPRSWPMKASFTELVLQHDRTASLEDIALRPDLKMLPVAGHPPFGAVLASPLQLKDMPVGAVTIYSNTTQEWTTEQFHLIEWLAAQCSHALDALRLQAEVREGQRQNEFLAGILERSSQPFVVGYPDGRLGLANDAFAQLTGYSREELQSVDWARTLTPPEWLEIELPKLEDQIRTGRPINYEKEYVRKDGTRVPIELLVHLVKDAEGKPLYYYSFLADITERKRAEGLTEARLRMMVASNDPALSLDETLRMLLDEIEARTGSVIGFYHYMEPDQETLSLQTWSTNTLRNMCMAEGKGRHYPVSDAGVWVECVRRRRTVIHNDYASLPDRKGLPAGHAPVIREMVVPIMRGGRIVAIIGVGNKPTNYDPTDADTVSHLGDFSWEIVERKRAEEALRQREQLLQNVIDGSTSPIFLKDLDGKFITINASLERMLGISRDKLKGKTDYDIAPKEVADYWRTHDKQVMATGKAIQIEEVADLPDGHHIFLANKFPLVNADGHTYGVGSISHDITERKRGEEALQLSEEKFAKAFAGNPAGVALTRLDDGLFLDVNDAWAAMNGYSREEAIGHFARKMHIWPTDDAAAHFVQTLREKGAVRGWEQQFHKKSGEVFVAEFSAQLLTLGAEKVILTIMVDITARRQAEEALRQSEARFRTLFDTMSEGFSINEIICDDRGKPCDLRYLAVNPAFERHTGLKAADIAGRTCLELFPQAEPEWFERYGKVALTGEPAHFESAFGPLGRWFEVSSYQTEPGRFAVVFFDISERKRAEEALRELNLSLERRVTERTAEVQQQADQLRALAVDLSQAEQRERKRLAGILHDHIQQLLVAAQLQLSLIERADPTTVRSTAQGINSIIAEAITASRSLTVELSPPILHQSGLTAALTWLAAREEETHLFKVHVRANSDAEPADPDVRALLFSSVQELLLNAVKHSGVREAQLIMRRSKENWTQIIVEDKGKGFDPSAIAAHRGGGFGLFSIQQRLAYLGGRMEVDSAPGRGARFVLMIPIGQAAAKEAASAAPTAPPAAMAPVHTKGRRISVLLVDDHRIMRQGLTSLLEFEEDIEVVAEAENGRQAVELAHQYVPDVIIMDVNMPVMNGIEATRILSKELPEVKVIALSMHQERDTAEAMRQAGAVAYLTKGGPSEDLVAAIRACSGSRTTES